jgi:hypothetical protein
VLFTLLEFHPLPFAFFEQVKQTRVYGIRSFQDSLKGEEKTDKEK